MERHARHYAMTLALEPDWLLLAAPDWRLVWASVCFPTRWSLAGKAGLPLPDIHAAVPGLNQELGRKIDVFFGPVAARGRLDQGQLGPVRKRGTQPASLPRPFTPLSERTPDAAVSIRVESQDFCKLPQTGAIAFGIRILNFPLASVKARPAIAAGLESAASHHARRGGGLQRDSSRFPVVGSEPPGDPLSRLRRIQVDHATEPVDHVPLAARHDVAVAALQDGRSVVPPMSRPAQHPPSASTRRSSCSCPAHPLPHVPGHVVQTE